MYEEFFKLSSPPFRLNPDPKFFFGSRSHNKAMAYLHYGLRQGEGFIVITGEIGAGKSMLISHLLDQLDRSNVVAAHLPTANLKPSALLSHILSAFRIEPAGAGESAAIEAFEDFLFDQMNRGRRVLLIVDEAQNLPVKTIEELRMLSNMDYDGTPLFQVFLVGQPEFRGILSKPDMEQFRQRVIASYHLEPLCESETTDYIKHRLSLVGWNEDPSISESAFAAIFKATGGVPRKINKLCNRIFLYCGLEKRHAIDAEVVENVVTDLRSETVGAVELSPEDARAPGAAGESKDALETADAAGDETRESEPAPRARRAVASGERKAAASNKKTGAPVVIPFEQARRGGSKEAGHAAAGEAVEKEAAQQPLEQDEKRERGRPAEAPDIEAREGGMGARTPEVSAESGQEHMSVLDRLRSRRRLQPTESEVNAETAARLKDIAKAIEEAAGAPLSGDDDDADVEAALRAIDEPGSGADPQDSRQAVVRSMNDMRDELKAAHRSVASLRLRLAENDQQRKERRREAAETLARAETLLAEIRSSWR
jgi:putative secretion ATPase (PEP-CTERM system associated)